MKVNLIQGAIFAKPLYFNSTFQVVLWSIFAPLSINLFLQVTYASVNTSGNFLTIFNRTDVQIACMRLEKVNRAVWG